MDEQLYKFCCYADLPAVVLHALSSSCQPTDLTYLRQQREITESRLRTLQTLSPVIRVVVWIYAAATIQGEM